jgi:hypothetical protein
MKLEFVKAKRRYYIIGINSGQKRYVDPTSIHSCREPTRNCSGASCGHRRCIVELNEPGRNFCLPKEGILEE